MLSKSSNIRTCSCLFGCNCWHYSYLQKFQIPFWFLGFGFCDKTCHSIWSVHSAECSMWSFQRQLLLSDGSLNLFCVCLLSLRLPLLELRPLENPCVWFYLVPRRCVFLVLSFQHGFLFYHRFRCAFQMRNLKCRLSLSNVSDRRSAFIAAPLQFTRL